MAPILRSSRTQNPPRLASALALALAVASLLLAGAAPDSPPTLRTEYVKSRSFRIPFTIDKQDRVRVKVVQLWYSAGQETTWQLAGESRPNLPSITFRAPREGEYRFAVRTIDDQGHASPTDQQGLKPSLKVIVDTPPEVRLKPGGRRGNLAWVRWEIQDADPDLSTLTLEYRDESRGDWREVPLPRKDLIDERTWDAGTAVPLKVRLSVKDRAGNLGRGEVDLADGLASPAEIAEQADPAPAQPPEPLSRRTQPTQASHAAPPNGATLFVASPRFALQYAVDDARPEDPIVVELWATRDGGRTWKRLGEDPDRTPPMQVDLSQLGGDGTYGLSITARGANGLGDTPPAPGDPPQTWVEVDTTPPDVQLDTPRVATGPNAGKVQITWRATDRNLADHPITLFYRADDPTSPWEPIVGPIENTGSFVWTVPATVPARFQVRVDAVDRAGNRGSANTGDRSPIVLDRTRPRSRILGMAGPAGDNPGASNWNQANPIAPVSNTKSRVWLIAGSAYLVLTLGLSVVAWRRRVNLADGTPEGRATGWRRLTSKAPATASRE